MIKTLGTGGFAAVYLGRWHSTNVAVKKIPYNEHNTISIISEVSLYRFSVHSQNH
jgi:serine/threonine protein kinase